MHSNVAERRVPEEAGEGSAQATKINTYIAGGSIAAAVIGGSLITNGLITGGLLFISLTMLLYHTRKKWPRVLPFLVKYKNWIDTAIFFAAGTSFLTIGVTASIALGFFALFTTGAFIYLDERGYGKK